MSKQPRFEVVRSDAGWFARFIAANGREVWRTSESYQRRRGAERAVVLAAEALGCGDVVLSSLYIIPGDLPQRWVTSDGSSLEVRYLDERGKDRYKPPFTITAGTSFIVDPSTSTTIWNTP